MCEPVMMAACPRCRRWGNTTHRACPLCLESGYVRRDMAVEYALRVEGARVGVRALLRELRAKYDA